jgi:hypothetical protein
MLLATYQRFVKFLPFGGRCDASLPTWRLPQTYPAYERQQWQILAPSRSQRSSFPWPVHLDGAKRDDWLGLTLYT